MVSAGLIELENRYGAHNYEPLDVVIERASGAWVYDTEGRRYLDFLAAGIRAQSALFVAIFMAFRPSGNATSVYATLPIQPRAAIGSGDRKGIVGRGKGIVPGAYRLSACPVHECGN